MYILFNGDPPYEEFYDPNVEVNYSNIPQNAQDLLKHLLCADPSKRWSAKEALDHDFFKF